MENTHCERYDVGQAEMTAIGTHSSERKHKDVLKELDPQAMAKHEAKVHGDRIVDACARVVADPTTAARATAEKLGVCYRCGEALNSPDSLHRGRIRELWQQQKLVRSSHGTQADPPSGKSQPA